MRLSLITLGLILLLFTSCSKEELYNYECGIVTDKATYYDAINGISVFYIELNYLGFRVDYLTYLRAELYKELCLTR